ncbi:MAG: DUF342 domain-containing protein [Desulfobacter sp.]|nr:MAG: DUF342 domain-containing protein [Desulfobacter sp.]
MNNPIPPSPCGPADPDRLRQKADILETNLFKSVTKQDDPITLRFQINRETSPDPVIIKALIQLFPRLNLRSPKILLFIKKILDRPTQPGEVIKLRKKILDLSGAGEPQTAHLSIYLQAVVSSKALAVEIRGTAPVPGRDGDIDKALFDHERCPGLIHADGVIDFREINKYPIVRKGDNLFFITPPVQGKAGIQYDGTIVPVEKTMPMVLTLREGVRRVEDRSGGAGGAYFIRSTKTGVVVLTRKDGQITDIEVRDALDIKRLDYSTGNIGSRFICPISMTIDTICDGFRIRAKGAVAVREVDGGDVETDETAVAHTVHPGSRIKARKDIIVNFSHRCRLTALDGRITVRDEMTDTRADGKSISFEKSRGVLSGATLDTQQLTLKNLYFNGENRIYFGHRLFAEKDNLLAARKKLQEKNLARETQLAEIRAALQKEIHLLAKTLKTHLLLRDNLAALIQAARDLEYNLIYKELEAIAESMNTKEVIQIKKNLDRLRDIPEQIQKTASEANAILDRMAVMDREMTEMKLDIDGLLRRAATLKIFIPGAEDTVPAMVAESKTDKATRIRIQGQYTPAQGFQLTRL